MSINPDSSKNGKFYALTPEEFLELNRLLKDAELRVYLYLVTNHPWSDRKVETDTAIIAEHLGLTRRTIQRAIRRLEELELIEIELSKFKYCQSRRQVKERLRTTDGSPKRQMDRQSDTKIVSVTDGSPKRQMDRLETPETLSEAVSSSPQTIQTYSDFIKTLSEDERESFLEFGKKKAAQLPKPPELPLKWIEKNFDDLRSLYEKQNGIVRCSHRWENDHRRLEWLDKIRSLGFAAFIYEDGKLNFERKEFYEWANSKNLIWGAES
ncbi:helix-turn-helix domain-containing protein [Chroococcus sp. FPU101]|uniref:helix-turn-helix domain-containing protein n=1 Tax=Chroococcus sp. FPU101 TaxID=1974212 RepID=UPI001A8D1F28|nr:helix-turn-helix domain-containing protein [Chroococcus sp. FPU101]GFE72259.1 hypothetical protein CFPU101_48690 [Chroococcus sp. FPU101]